ncbi:DUF2314 domain-containing protein [Phenylobacterium sp. J367]|uniref:DUF2314 domain-containing protein n=1 Tax=Phenylobacterium sp. J367 TaxID=2898435 RepID=UPI0021512609|nr:DUF2314 domain-containing protein [Phenylobacterium sp. J367]MCR5879985.1 DUF2314 domain-containing protein [Phenylobacterium sp. J367]
MRALTIGAAMTLLAACGQGGAAPAAEAIVQPPAEDAALAAAEKRARETLPVFWSKFDQQAPGTSNYSVKVALQAPGGYTEHIWAQPLTHSEAEVVAKLLNDPVRVTGLAYGSEVRVQPNQISDWAYGKDGKYYGHFTTRALTQYATPEQRAQAAAILAAEPLETEVR